MIAAPQLPTIKISKRKIRTLLDDNEKSAKAINLVYVNDKQAGISRKKVGKEFVYTLGGKKVNDKDTLLRIKQLVIPPAWEDVWVCAQPDGHIQATGLDMNGRKQYRYHALWNALRSETKFFHLHDFGEALPEIRKRIKSALAMHGLPLEKVLATIVSLMEYTGVRIGNNVYEKLYGSYGLTTLHDEHVKISGSEMKFSFRGKKGVSQNFSLKSKRLANIVRQCKDIPGKELFQYYDETGARRTVDSGMVNSYIKSISGGKSFTAKDFRTWVGTLCAFETFIDMECCDSATETKKKIVEMLDTVAERLGNTRTVCRKYYVHPLVIEHYTNKTIEKYKEQVCNCSDNELTAKEQILLKILAKADTVTIKA